MQKTTTDIEKFKQTDLIHKVHLNIKIDFWPSEIEVMKALAEKNGWELGEVIKHAVSHRSLGELADVFFKDDPKTRAKLRRALGLKD